MRSPCAFLVMAALLGCGEGPPPGSPAWYAMELQKMRITNMVVDLDAGVMTAGQLTEEQFVRMDEFGFRAIVCLRPADEEGTGWEEKMAADRKLEFVRIPIRGPEDLTRANAERLDAVLAAPGTEVVYCDTSDRTGALLALHRHLVGGAPPGTALAFGKAHGLSDLADATKAALDRVGK